MLFSKLRILVFGFQPRLLKPAPINTFRKYVIKISGFYLAFLFIVISSQTSGEEACKSLPKKKHLSESFSRGELIIKKVLLRHANDLPQIESTGVSIQTREHGYIIVLANRKQLADIHLLGVTMLDPIESDHKIRNIRVLLHNIDELACLRLLISDVWLEHWPGEIQLPVYIKGRAYDNEIEWTKESGIEIQRCEIDCK